MAPRSTHEGASRTVLPSARPSSFGGMRTIYRPDQTSVTVDAVRRSAREDGFALTPCIVELVVNLAGA
jgi:hypothetical protein